MNQTDNSPTKDFFEEFITRYGRAWDSYDLQAILDYYHTPCFIFKDGTLFANLSEDVKFKYFQETLDSYRRQDYARAEIPHCDVRLMGPDSALVTVRWVCRRSDGSVAFDFWDAYHLIHLSGNWKILGDTVYE